MTLQGSARPPGAPANPAPGPAADPGTRAVPLVLPPAPAHHDLIVIGASAGGVQALEVLLAALPGNLPGNLPAAIFVTVHFSPESRSQLPMVFGRRTALSVDWAGDQAPILTSEVRVAPPDEHLLIEPGRMRVMHGPRENRHRPAIDPMFRSAAWSYGPRVVGVVLTGYLDDGTAGLWAIKSCGGTTIVQDPAEARHPDMPQNALMHNRIDHSLPLADIAALLVRLAREPAGQPMAKPDGVAQEIGFATMDRGMGDMGDMSRLGTLSPFTCPTCRGALWELDEGGHLRYRCHTGHAFTHASLLLEQGSEIESSVYAALRVVEEKAAALRRLSERWSGRFPQMTAGYEGRAREMDHTAATLRALLAGALPAADNAAG
jgi:two-component system, chemotaxis family, protein-glutamate methylesterase/glutaminase